jgi:ATP-binding cassette subfamily C protein CydC
MSPLWRIAVLIWREERAALSRGLLLSIIVLLAGAALLGLSGWFVTAAGAAGVAGIGIAFDVFRPSAGVRMLALGRTAARYGERILTHDATLRALARLRVKVLDGLAAQPAETLARLRSPAMLNRVTADVDALDGVAIRLVFPILAGGTHAARRGGHAGLAGGPCDRALGHGHAGRGRDSRNDRRGSPRHRTGRRGRGGAADPAQRC